MEINKIEATRWKSTRWKLAGWKSTRWKSTGWKQLVGNQLDGNQLNGNQLDVNQLDGNQLDGNQLDRNQLDGNQLDVNKLDGNPLDGNQLDGNIKFHFYRTFKWPSLYRVPSMIHNKGLSSYNFIKGFNRKNPLVTLINKPRLKILNFQFVKQAYFYHSFNWSSFSFNVLKGWAKFR